MPLNNYSSLRLSNGIRFKFPEGKSVTLYGIYSVDNGLKHFIFVIYLMKENVNNSYSPLIGLAVISGYGDVFRSQTCQRVARVVSSLGKYLKFSTFVAHFPFFAQTESFELIRKNYRENVSQQR